MWSGRDTLGCAMTWRYAVSMTPSDVTENTHNAADSRTSNTEVRRTIYGADF